MNNETRAPGRWARCARWLGLDHNPMRRRDDRLEVVLRLTTVLLILTAVPLAVIGVGRTVDHLVIRQAQTERATDRLISAVLTQAAPAQGTPDPYSDVQTAWVPARWTAPNGTAHSGQVLALAGAAVGTTVRIWVTASGAATDPPAGAKDVMAEVAVTVMVTGTSLILIVLGAEALACRSLDRRRSRAWDAEWRAIGPRWSDHHS